MTKTNANATRFTVDFFNAVIIGTKASFNKASKGTGDAYEELTRLMAAHPNFKLEVKEQKHHIERAKRTYDGMNFKFMETYIAIALVQRLLQHSSSAITQRYIGVEPQRIEEAILNHTQLI